MVNLKGLVGNHQITAKIKDLELIHASLDDDIADVHLLRGPWRPSRIPPEILCEIFHYYICLFRHSTWTISQVCRAWRRIALGCSTLWNELYISSLAPKSSTAYRSRHPFGWNHLTTELQTQRAIRRTRGAPLRIKLALNERTQNPNAVLRVLNIVAGQNLTRWRSFVWENSTIGVLLTPVLQKVFLPTQEMTSLEHISFQCKYYDLLLPTFIAGVPSLSSMELRLDDGDPTTTLMNQPWLGRLKKLTLVFYRHLRSSAVGAMVGECKALEELNVRRQLGSPSSDGPFDSAGWRLSRDLRIALLHTKANLWPCVSGLNITSLNLYMGNRIRETLSIAPRSISLPSLTNLTCLSYETTFTAGYLLDAPKTQSMHISHWTTGSINASPSTRDIFRDKPWGIYPNNVILQTDNRDEMSLQDLFLRLSKMNTLSLYLYTPPIDALLALIPDLERYGDTVVCPNLTRLECEFWGKFKNSEASRVDSLVLAIQQRRGDMGLLCPSVNVRWKEW